MHELNGDKLFCEQKYLEAIDEYKIAVNEDPTLLSNYYNIGVCYSKLKDYDNALDFYKKVLIINDNYVNAYYNIAVDYYKQGNLKLAYIYINRALALESTDEDFCKAIKVIEKSIIKSINDTDKDGE